MAYHNIKPGSSGGGLQTCSSLWYAKKRERKKAPPALGAEQLEECKHNCEPNGWPCVLPQAFEDVQTQMMDFTRQTAKCHILRQQGLAWQTNIPTQGGTGWGWLEEPYPLWIYWFALLNREGSGLKAALSPLCQAQLQQMRAGPSFGPQIKGDVDQTLLHWSLDKSSSSTPSHRCPYNSTFS